MPPNSDTRRENRRKSNEAANAAQRYHNAVQDEIHALRRLKAVNADLTSVEPTDLIAIREELLQQTPRPGTEVMNIGIGEDAKTLSHIQSYDFEWKEKPKAIPKEIVKPQELPYVAEGYVEDVKHAKFVVLALQERVSQAESELHGLQRPAKLDAVMKDVDFIFTRSLRPGELIAIRKEILRRIG